MEMWGQCLPHMITLWTRRWFRVVFWIVFLWWVGRGFEFVGHVVFGH